MGFQSLHAFWLFDWFGPPQPLPPYVLEHPGVSENAVYGVGSGKNFLEAKTRALNDIATQLRSDVRSITSVRKNSAEESRADQQITVLTRRVIDNYTVLDETHAGGTVYLLIEYRR